MLRGDSHLDRLPYLLGHRDYGSLLETFGILLLLFYLYLLFYYVQTCTVGITDWDQGEMENVSEEADQIKCYWSHTRV